MEILTTSLILCLAAYRAVSASPNHVAERQITSTPSSTSTAYPVTGTLTFGEFPSGPAPPGGLESNTTIPYPCIYSCNGIGVYESCFIFFRPFNSSTYDPAICEASICTQQFYDKISTCLNCIIAQGGEAPAPENPMRAAPLDWVRPHLSPLNPNGPIDLVQANGWLRNITERCTSVGKGLTGPTTITVSPTTTGPYYTSWARGETVSPPIWTETNYTPPGRTLTYTMTGPPGASAISSGAVNAAAASQSARSGVGRRMSCPGQVMAMGVGGLVLLRMMA